MAEIILLGFLTVIGIAAVGAFIYYSTRRGEDCPGYPHKCPWCGHAAECIIEIGRKKDDA